ncbi:hypothetical protein [Polyangium jinanense]|uniref:Uncharacterized protein n=1 Tax=Polyangium jinanense TaxID=2829994 RepID=A0A9X4AVE9_9BACT|nr:hypothetical protein [Polyangium jinanense]MDC3986198.1 hypothetical protein [Polyangium jinanense]
MRRDLGDRLRSHPAEHADDGLVVGPVRAIAVEAMDRCDDLIDARIVTRWDLYLLSGSLPP